MTASETMTEYFWAEVDRNINCIEEALTRLKDNPEDRDSLSEISEAAKAIADLSMVHGYEGIETIACRLDSTVKTVKDPRVSPEIIAEIEETMGVMKEAVSTSDEKEIVHKITIPEEDVEETEHLFDIKEPEYLFSLMSEEGGEVEEVVVSPPKKESRPASLLEEIREMRKEEAGVKDIEVQKKMKDGKPELLKRILSYLGFKKKGRVKEAMAG